MISKQYISPVDATAPHPDVSKRYKFVSTRDAITALEAQGFIANPLIKTRGGQFGMHGVTLTHPDLKAIQIGDSLVLPRVMLKNSHDTSAAFGLIAGAYRFACFNGLVLGHGFAVRLIHTGDIQRDINEALPNLFETVKRGIQQMQAWSNLKLSPASILEYSNSMLDLRFNPIQLEQIKGLNIGSILAAPKRDEDRSNDLFTVYNRVQEKLINGGYGYWDGNRLKTIRKLSGLRATLSINQRLSERTEQYYNLIKGVK